MKYCQEYLIIKNDWLLFIRDAPEEYFENFKTILMIGFHETYLSINLSN